MEGSKQAGRGRKAAKNKSTPFQFKKAGFKSKLKAKANTNLKQMISADSNKFGNVVGSYNFIESGYSIKPAKKYCNFTGFHAKYTDKKTRLSYFSFDLFNAVENITYDQLKQRDMFNSI
ncbi:unnamed protein product [Moneuplotes crassus]|uniref:Vps72/YL1 C-terminal domain-containing protein n=1 Tax=Euplotes crassus TaxID=5936 RepID=A0AAD1Y1E5_EUPCR|nr:unnamed protein product [Moneuplotes crassus]